MSLVEFDEFFLSVSDFEDKGEVVMVSEISGFDMNPIQEVVVSDFLSPDLGNLRVLPLVACVVVGVVVDLTEVFQDEIVNSNLFVTHCTVKLFYLYKYLSNQQTKDINQPKKIKY